MTLDLSDEETAALLGELDRIIDGDRYPFSPRIQTLTASSAEPGWPDDYLGVSFRSTVSAVSAETPP